MTFHEVLQREMLKNQPTDVPKIDQAPRLTPLKIDYKITTEELINPELKHVFKSKQGLTKYPKTHTIRSRQEIPPPKIELILHISELDAEATLALECLKRLAPDEHFADIISESQIKKLQRKLVRRYHPDTNPEAPHSLIQDIQEAKKLLMSHLKKSAPKAA